MKDIDKVNCPEIPWFGATYPDARCIDGLLWDLDSCTDDSNLFTVGGDVPCPFCKTQDFIEYDPFSWEDDILMEHLGEYLDEVTEKDIKIAKAMAKDRYIKWINSKLERYGKQRH